MSDDEDARFFHLRKEARTYISKLFKWGAQSTERLRNVRMVMEGSDVLHVGEIEGALCLRLTGCHLHQMMQTNTDCCYRRPAGLYSVKLFQVLPNATCVSQLPAVEVIHAKRSS